VNAFGRYVGKEDWANIPINNEIKSRVKIFTTDLKSEIDNRIRVF